MTSTSDEQPQAPPTQTPGEEYLFGLPIDHRDEPAGTYRDPAAVFDTEFSPLKKPLALELLQNGHAALALFVENHGQLGWTKEDARKAIGEWKLRHRKP